MAKLAIKPGSTSVLVRIFIQDSESTTGGGKTGLTNTSFTSTKVGVARDDDGNAGATQVSLTAGTKGTWSSGSIVEKDSTYMPGIYELGLTNASLAAGSRSCEYEFIGTGIVPCLLEIDLGNDANVTSWNGTAVSSPATAGIPDVNVKNINNVAAATPGASGGLFIAGTNAATTADITGNITGNLSGSVGSITGNVGGNVVGTVASVVGAVGSVTGNVGGNVTGSVGSVVGLTIKKNTSLTDFMFYMALASDNRSPATGLTITSTVALDGGSFGATVHDATEMTGGWYAIDLDAADVNGGTVALEFDGGVTAVTARFTFATQP